MLANKLAAFYGILVARKRILTKDIRLLGGANLAKGSAENGLIDEIILSIVPQILADGIPLNLSFNRFY